MKYIDEAGVIVAGGLHPAARDQYFRVGHMGAVSAGEFIATLSAIEAGLIRAGYMIEQGAGVAAASRC